LILAPQIKAALMETPSKSLYIADVEGFGIATSYEPDLAVRSRIVLVYSNNQEVKWQDTNVFALTAIHLHAFTGMQVIPYETLANQVGDHIFVEFNKPGIWLNNAFAADHANVKSLGPAFGGGAFTGEAVSVRFANE
jgi:hypothetical protein